MFQVRLSGPDGAVVGRVRQLFVNIEPHCTDTCSNFLTGDGQAFNPFTTKPVEGMSWASGPTFGQAVSRLAYTPPRTLRLMFGVRF